MFIKGTHSPLFHPRRNSNQVELQDKGRALCLKLGKVWKSGNHCGNSEPELRRKPLVFFVS